MEQMNKKFGLWTGIAMIVGVVIGSGVFLKAGGVLALTGGKLSLSLLAWLIGGIIMITSAYCFAIFASRVKKFNGAVDYVEISTNKRVGYHLAWLMTTLYYPTIAAIVAVYGSAFFIDLITPESHGIFELLTQWQTYLVAFGFITIFCLTNFLAPKLSGKSQVSLMVIKLIPIVLIAIIGLILCIVEDGSGNIILSSKITEIGTGENVVNDFGEAIKKTAFAYEGWVCATMINAELKNSKQDLPKVLVGGTIAVIIFYICYYIGVSSILGNTKTIEYGANAPLVIFNQVFGNVGEKILCLFIIVSCLGTLNGLILATSRGMYTMSCRGLGPTPDKFSKLDKRTGMPFRSCLIGYICLVTILCIWYLANAGVPFFSYLNSMDEIICACIYGTFITMFIYIMKNFKDLKVYQRFIVPIFATIGCLFFVLCGTGIAQLIFDKSAHALISFSVWLILFVIVMVPSFFFYNKNAEGIIDETNDEEAETVIVNEEKF